MTHGWSIPLRVLEKKKFSKHLVQAIKFGSLALWYTAIKSKVHWLFLLANTITLNDYAASTLARSCHLIECLTKATDDSSRICDQTSIVVFEPFPKRRLWCPKNWEIQKGNVCSPCHKAESNPVSNVPICIRSRIRSRVSYSLALGVQENKKTLCQLIMDDFISLQCCVKLSEAISQKAISLDCGGNWAVYMKES